MNRPVPANWLRRAEIVLSAAGLSLLGAAFATTFHTQVHEARQGRAFSAPEPGRAASANDRPSPPIPESASQAASVPEADPLVLGRLEIPRLGVTAIVREGGGDPTPAAAVRHIPGTALPGERGNMALAGHRDFYFRALRRVEVDDVIRFWAPGRGFAYRVSSIELVGAGETRVLQPTPDAVLTLVTSYPFAYVAHASSRFIVRASRLEP